MSFTLGQLLKGGVAQTLTHTLFERAGYRVARLGIEELFREVKLLSEADYHRLALPPNLRLLPDFLVSDRSLTNAFLIEVKFRTTFDCATTGLRNEIEAQRVAWPGVHVIVLVAKSPNPKHGFLQDHVRVIPPQKDLEYVFNDRMSPSERWDQLWRMTNVFDGFKAIQKEADAILAPLKELSSV